MNNKKLKIFACALFSFVITAGIATVLFLYNNGQFKPAHNFAKPQENQIRVACVGDSVTYGMTMKNWSKNAYPFLLRQMLGKNYCTQNFGFSGRTVMQSGDRPYMNEKLYTQSLTFEPDIVILQIGSNDSKTKNWTDTEEFKADYKKILESYIVLPSSPKVFVCTPPPAFEYNGEVKYDIQADIIENEISPAIKEIAKEKNIPVIDLMELFSGHSELFNDGLHPNTDGGKLLANAVYEAITTN